MSVKRILVALSGTPFTPAAVQLAIELAQSKSASITGVTVVDTDTLESVGAEPIGGGFAAAAAIAGERIAITKQRVEEQIEAFNTACNAARVEFVVDRETGDPLDTLASLSRYHDVTVFGLRGLFDYGVIQNPDDQLTRLLARGVRPIIAVARESRPIRRVMIAYNGSMESAKALKQFVGLRLWPDANLSIVCVEDDAPEAAELIRDARAYCAAHGFDVETNLLQGRACDSLLNHAASWNADMIVLGSTNRSRLAQFLLGDTALRMIRDADIPLFLAQ